jgi:NAD(P)-dependent dehydrogenase (short-subunit alcohol dehydrogenase family)
MRYLILGPASPINLAIVDLLTLSDKVELTWALVEGDKYQSEQIEESSKLRVFKKSRKESIKEVLKSMTTGYDFNGVVYAEGIGGVRPVKMTSDSFLQEMFDANVFKFFDLISSLLKQKRLAKGASVLTLSSVSSVKGLKSKSAYSASKAALDAAVRGVASELAPQGIRVNSILKGWVDADMSLDFIQSNMKLSKGSDFDQQPLGAIKTTEIANLVEFLLSDKVKTITGTSILVDGGYTL